jgi:hypothetical protein
MSEEDEDFTHWANEHRHLSMQRWVWKWKCLKEWVRQYLPETYEVMKRVQNIEDENMLTEREKTLLWDSNVELERRCPYICRTKRNGEYVIAVDCSKVSVKLEEKLNVYNPETREIERIEWKEVKPDKDSPKILKPP